MRPGWSNRPGASLNAGENVHPFFEHLRMPVADVDREVGVPGRAQLANAVLQLMSGGRERQHPDEVGRADLVLLRSQGHEMSAVVLQVARVGRLVARVVLALVAREM